MSEDAAGLHVLVSVPDKGESLKLEWVSVYDSRPAMAQIQSGTNTINVASQIVDMSRDLFLMAKNMHCEKLDAESTDQPVSKVQLKCSKTAKLEALYPLTSTFLSVGFCKLRQLETCGDYEFVEGEEDCQHDFVALYTALHETFYENRQKRSLFYSTG